MPFDFLFPTPRLTTKSSFKPDLRNRWFAGCFFAICLLSFLGCESKTPEAAAGIATPANAQEQLVNKALKVQGDALDLLTNIRDQQSAEAAFAGLENILAEIERLIAEAKRSGALTPESKARILAEIDRRKGEITQKVKQFTGQVASNPQLLNSLQPLLQKLDEVRRQIDGFLN